MDKKTKRDRGGYSPILTVLILTLLTTSSTISFMMWQSNWQDDKMDNYEGQMNDANNLINETFEDIKNSTEVSENYTTDKETDMSNFGSRP